MIQEKYAQLVQGPLALFSQGESNFLSSGEVTLQEKMTEMGRHVTAGQEVRMPNLPADAGAGLGLFQCLHNFPNASDFADHLRVAAETYHGTAGPAFLHCLARERADDPGRLTNVICELRDSV